MGAGVFKNDQLTGLEIAALNIDQERKHHYVSFSDIKKDQEFLSSVGYSKTGLLSPGDVTKELLYKLLHKYGLDTNKPFDRVFCFHRSYDGTLYKGPRWQGIMRGDRKWVDYIFTNTGVKLPSNREARA